MTAKPSIAYLYSTGQVNQSIKYNIVDLGKAFHPSEVTYLLGSTHFVRMALG